MSGDGRHMAVGQPLDDKVTVYYPFLGSWNQRLNIIEGPPNSMFGERISFSDDLYTFAVGGSEADTKKGMVQVWTWDNDGYWTQQGSTISGQNSFDKLGSSLDFASHSHHLVVGSKDEDSNDSRGSVRVFKYDGQDWVQQGATIYGDDANDNFGGEDNSISITKDGDFMSISSSAACKVKSYAWDGSAWNQMGSTIYGAQSTGFGTSIALVSPSNGEAVLAVSAPLENSSQGTIRVFDWNGTSSNWTERAEYISTEGERRLGMKMRMSDDASLIVSSSSLALLAYKWGGSGWSRRGGPDGVMRIPAASSGSYGPNDMSIDISRYGNEIAVGLPNDADGLSAGNGEVQSFVWTKDGYYDDDYYYY